MPPKPRSKRPVDVVFGEQKPLKPTYSTSRCDEQHDSQAVTPSSEAQYPNMHALFGAVAQPDHICFAAGWAQAARLPSGRPHIDADVFVQALDRYARARGIRKICKIRTTDVDVLIGIAKKPSTPHLWVD